VTKSISRFGRNTADTLAAINELRLYDVEVCFDQEDMSTKDPYSSLMISILEGVAQEESAARSKNISWGILRKVENGTSPACSSVNATVIAMMRMNSCKSMNPRLR